MQKREKGNIPEMHELHEKEMESECGDMRDILGAFRDSHHAAADRTGHFWNRLHDSIMDKLETPASLSKFRYPLLVAPVAMAAVVVLCLIYFTADSRLPVPDIAAGYDQELLIEVDRMLSRDCPKALDPAALLAGEIERGSVRQ
jgi:hypothetical protein